jgi:hypothetical protein
MRKWILSRLILTAIGCGFVIFWLLHGARPGRVQVAAPAKPPANLALGLDQEAAKKALATEAERAQADASVWGIELLAERHEDVFLDLWDGLRAGHHKAAILGQFPFGQLVLGQLGAATNVNHGIQISRQNGAARTLTPDTWRKQIQDWSADGYELVDSEWRQASFTPSANGAAQSSISVTLHAIHPQRHKRWTARGTLTVNWREAMEASEQPFPLRIDATDLELLGRREAPAFEHALAKEYSTTLNPVFIDPLIVYDLNGDGLAEILLVGQNVVLWNRGGGQFEAGKLCQEPVASVNTAIVGDFNGDGLPDLLGADRDGLLLFVGGPGGTFTSPAKRLTFTATELPNAFVLAAGDVNGDGALDVWLAQYKLPYVAGQMPTPYYDANDGFPSFLLLNDGRGNFRDATAEAGLAKKRFRRTYSASFVDLDNDGHLDLLVVSDFAGVDLYLNDGHGHFTDITESALDESHAFGMAHTFGDYDGDGQLDFLVVGMNSYTAQRLDQLGLGPPDLPEMQAMRPKMDSGNRLYFGRGSSWQQDARSKAVACTGWSWGATSFDFDNDGTLDLYIVNGHKSRASTKDYERQFWRHDIYVGSSHQDPGLEMYFRAAAERLYGAGMSYGGHEKNRLFMNQGGGSFLEIGFLAGVAMPEDCRDVVSEDLDNDGKVDLVVTTLEVWPRDRQALHVLRNRVPDTGRWIGFHLRESRPGFSPIGSTITIKTPSGHQVRRIVTGDSYRSQHPNTAHFGLGSETEVESVEVRWPNGQVQHWAHPGIDQYHELLPSP